MSAAWNEENQKGHSMSAQAQKNRQKRERRKAAGRTGGGGGNSGSTADKVEVMEQHYQQNLESLLGMAGGGVSLAPPDPSVWNPPPSRRTSSPPPGFGGVSRAPPPGFSPVPKNAARKQVLAEAEMNAAISKLADLGFSSNTGGADFGVIGGGNVGGQQQPTKKYVSARGGYKLRL
jgi:hypothetical protein